MDRINMTDGKLISCHLLVNKFLLLFLNNKVRKKALKETLKDSVNLKGEQDVTKTD